MLRQPPDRGICRNPVTENQFNRELNRVLLNHLQYHGQNKALEYNVPHYAIRKMCSWLKKKRYLYNPEQAPLQSYFMYCLQRICRNYGNTRLPTLYRGTRTWGSMKLFEKQLDRDKIIRQFVAGDDTKKFYLTDYNIKGFTWRELADKYRIPERTMRRHNAELMKYAETFGLQCIALNEESDDDDLKQTLEFEGDYVTTYDLARTKYH